MAWREVVWICSFPSITALAILSLLSLHVNFRIGAVLRCCASPRSRVWRRLRAVGLLRTSLRPLLEGSSSEDITSVWSLPHTHPQPNHGLYLHLSVFPVPPILWECLVGHPRVHPPLSSTNGEDDQIQDFPGLSAFLPPDLQLHSLRSPLGQSQWTYFQVVPRKPRMSIPL